MPLRSPPPPAICFRIQSDALNIALLSYLLSPCLSVKLLRFPAGPRRYHPLIKHTLNDAVMQTWLGVHIFSETERQTITSGEARAVKRGLGGRGGARRFPHASVRLSLSLSLRLTSTLAVASPRGAIKNRPPIYQLSATKTCIQQTL